MSELKAFDITVAEEGYCEGIVKYRRAVYDKSKADKVIAYQKYRRCLAMARWCRIHDEFTQLESERLVLPQNTLFLEYRRKSMWWNKWRKRWLELAQTLKEAK